MSSSLSPEQLAQICEWTQALYDERITPEQHAQLQEWVCRDKEACRVYVQYMNLCASIHWDKSQEARPLPNGKAKASKPPVLGFLGDVFQAGTNFLSRSFVLTLLLAIGLPVIVLFILLIDISHQPVAKAPVPAPAAVQQTRAVAEITRTYDAKWSNGDTKLATGTKLLANQHFRLLSGLAEITFADGAKVLLEGPATFNAQNNRQGHLQIGNLVAKVPKGAEGFTIVTPTANIVDLGTEFGISVSGDGTAEAHVFKGQVDVFAKSATSNKPATLSRHLHAGQAVQIIAGKKKMPEMILMAAAENKFVRQFLEDLPQPTILFAHHGSNNPLTEGWHLAGVRLEECEKEGIEIGPVVENATAAWSFRNKKPNSLCYYTISEKNGLSRELADEAQKKGWVLRARVWVNPQCQRDLDDPKQGLGFFGYGYGKYFFRIRLMLDQHGDQCNFREGVRDPFAGTAGQFVDYEIRYHPKTADADLYVNGRRVKTRIRFSKDKKTGTIPNRPPMLRFGLWKQPSESRYAKFEWGILREAPVEAPRVPKPNHEKP